MNPSFFGTVKQGRVVMDEPSGFKMWYQQFEGKVIEIVLRKKRRKRTTGQPHEEGNQNGYYFAVVLSISAKSLGYTVAEMHEVFTAQFAPFVYKDLGKKKIPVKIRTSMMDTVQFKEYTESIVIQMAELGVNIPDPIKVTN